MSITLDGTCYWLRQGPLHRVADSKKGTGVAWVKVGDNDSTPMYLFSVQGDNLSFQRNASNKFVLTGKNSGTVLSVTSETSYTNSSTWLGIVFAWDLSAGAGYIYVNRSDDTAAGATLTDSTVSISSSAFPSAFGCYYSQTLGLYAAAYGWVGSVFEFNLWPGYYVDPTDADELKFLISSDGVTDYVNPGPTASTPKPVGYGAQGALVTGGTPAAVIFGGAFTGNRGTGGSFTKTGSFSWVDPADDIKVYRQSGSPRARPGERSFDSETSGFTYPRHETFIERREGLDDFGRRMGIDERAERTRRERPGHEQNFTRLIYGDETDSEDRR